MMINEISQLRKLISNPTIDLGTELFHFVSELTPIVNVDLLVQKYKNNERLTLLTWRKDEFYSGWHFPGGVVRYKEALTSRVSEVAKIELGTSVTLMEGPVEVNEHISTSRNIRGHFISLLFRCTLNSEPDIRLKFSQENNLENGVWQYHSRKPENLIIQQNVYSKFF